MPKKKRIIASASKRKPPTNCPDAFLQCIEEDNIDDIEIGANTDISNDDEGNISESSGDFDIS